MSYTYVMQKVCTPALVIKVNKKKFFTFPLG